MIYDITVNEKEVTIKISGKIYVDEAMTLREQAFPYLEKGYTHFLFDFSRVDYIDSSGLGVLVALHKKANENDGKVKITGLQGEVHKLFELTRLTKVFTIV